MNLSASAVPANYDFPPPIIISAVVDSERRLEVVYNAPDGRINGGTVYLDNNPLNASSFPQTKDRYGDPMYCRQRPRYCLGRFSLPASPNPGTFTFLSEPIDPIKFPGGTYYIQILTFNREPSLLYNKYLFSNVSVVLLPTTTTTTVPPTTTTTTQPSTTTTHPAATTTQRSTTTTIASSVTLNVEKLAALKLPIDNGSQLCFLHRNVLATGNRLATTINKNVEKLKTTVEKEKNPSAKLKGDLALITEWIGEVSAM